MRSLRNSMKKTLRSNKPLQIVVSRNKNGFSVFSQSCKSVLKSGEGLDLDGVVKFIKRTKLGIVKGLE